MEAGDLQALIIVKRKAKTRDAIGGEVITWPPYLTLYAKAEPIRGREFISLQQIDVEIDVRFTIYYRDDIDSTMRVSWRGVDYEIVSPPIDVLAEKRWTELMCRTAQT